MMQNTGIIQIHSDLLRFADLLESQIAELKCRANKVQRHPAPFQFQSLVDYCHLFSSLVDFCLFFFFQSGPTWMRWSPW